MDVGIIGCGFVGNAVARGWMEHANVIAHDIDSRRGGASREAASAADIVFVCLPTNAARTATGYDTSALEGWFANHKASSIGSEQVIAIKSTVPVGFTAQMMRVMIGNNVPPNVVHNPEFLTARCAVADYANPSQQIIGSPVGASTSAANKLAIAMRTRFPGCPVRMMTSESSEITKLALNSIFATKVWLFNAIHLAAINHGADFKAIRQAILGDGRVTPSHTVVPGPDGKAGFGGACLPKDLAAFAGVVNDPDGNILDLIHLRNSAIRGDE